jgi:hypothetical protein
MNPETELWRKFLRKDPTRFLLDADGNPSVYLWYLIDLAHRPEDSSVVNEARERVLFSSPVQEVFAAQHSDGYWTTADSIAEPYHRATLWNLALLAELGIPRDSRRARAASEFGLQNFLLDDGRFAGLGLVESGYLIHALAYFRFGHDDRVLRAARALITPAQGGISFEGRVMALWAWADFLYDAEISAAADKVRGLVLTSIGSFNAGDFSPITHPPFDPRDPLFVSRVLTAHDIANDRRAGWLIESLLGKQNEQSHWPLERSLKESLIAHVEEATTSSHWATLNALRIIANLVKTRKN